MLSQVPRIILLILKTNDLSTLLPCVFLEILSCYHVLIIHRPLCNLARSLDESLQTKTGPEHTFMILARYCSRTVFEEEIEQLHTTKHLSRMQKLVKYLSAYAAYYRIDLKLVIYERYLQLKSMFKTSTTTTSPEVNKLVSLLQK